MVRHKLRQMNSGNWHRRGWICRGQHSGGRFASRERVSKAERLVYNELQRRGRASQVSAQKTMGFQGLVKKTDLQESAKKRMGFEGSAKKRACYQG